MQESDPSNSSPEPMSPLPSSPQQPNNNSKKIVAIAGAVVIALLLIVLVIFMMQPKSSAPTKEQTPQQQEQELLESQAYESAEHNLSIRYPVGWQVADQPDQGNYITITNPTQDTVEGHKYQSRVNVTYEPTTATLADYVGSVLDALPGALTDFQLVSNQNTTVDGNAAKVLEYTTRDTNNIPLTARQVIFIKDGVAYTTTGLATTQKWNDYKAAIGASLVSIKLMQQ